MSVGLARLAAYGGAAVVGGVAAVVSFGHLRAVALAAGESPVAATLLPVSVDGLLVSAAGVMVADRRSGRPARASARVAFAAGCVATVAGNLASATPTPLGWATAAWAPVALLLVTEMLVRHGHRRGRTQPAESHAEPRSHRATGARRGGRPRRTAERVAAAVAAHPGASVSALARAAGVSRSTIRRHINGHRPASVPAVPAQQGSEGSGS